MWIVRGIDVGNAKVLVEAAMAEKAGTVEQVVTVAAE